MNTIGILNGATDADLVRMHALLESTLRAVDIKIFDRKIGRRLIQHNDKTLSIKFIKETSEIEIYFK